MGFPIANHMRQFYNSSQQTNKVLFFLIMDKKTCGVWSAHNKATIIPIELVCKFQTVPLAMKAIK